MKCRITIFASGLSVFAMVLALALFVGSVPSAHAATFTVNSTADLADSIVGDGLCDAGAGVCTLRAAIQEANFAGAADTINVPAGTYLLSIANLTITNSVSIVGTGAAGTTIIDGQNTLQVFNLQSGTITLTNLVIQNGIVTIVNPGAFGACVGGGDLCRGGHAD